jgi:hypothetical protein
LLPPEAPTERRRQDFGAAPSGAGFDPLFILGPSGAGFDPLFILGPELDCIKIAPVGVHRVAVCSSD